MITRILLDPQICNLARVFNFHADGKQAEIPWATESNFDIKGDVYSVFTIKTFKRALLPELPGLKSGPLTTKRHRNTAVMKRKILLEVQLGCVGGRRNEHYNIHR